MDEAEIINKTQKFSIKVSFSGSWVSWSELAGQQEMYSVRNELSQCVFHNILELAQIPDLLLDTTNHGEIKDALVNAIKNNQKYCQCQKGARNFFSREKFVPSVNRLSGKSVKCSIKFRDGCLNVDTVIYFNAVQNMRV